MALSGRRILLLFGESLSAPEVVWSLQEAGAEVLVCFRCGSKSAARRLPGIRTVDSPAPTEDWRACLGEIRKAVDALGVSAVMPLEDSAILLAAEVLGSCQVLGPTGDQLSFAVDKRLQFVAAANAGFRVPPWTSWPDGQFESTTPINPKNPVVIKPALAGWIQSDRFVRGHPRFAADLPQANAIIAQENVEVPLIIQSVVQGVGEGLFGIAAGGSPRSISAHRRVRMMDPGGSGSSACVSREASFAETEAVRRFVECTDWSGMFMLETIRGSDEEAVWFMELNGRPWGSMALARRQGLEYPAWQAEYALDGVFPPDQPGITGLTCRHLGREILHALYLIRGNRGKSPNWPRPLDRLSVLAWARSHHWYNSDSRVFGYPIRDAWATIREKLSG